MSSFNSLELECSLPILYKNMYLADKNTFDLFIDLLNKKYNNYFNLNKLVQYFGHIVLIVATYKKNNTSIDSLINNFVDNIYPNNTDYSHGIGYQGNEHLGIGYGYRGNGYG